ncbi:S-protein homolog 5-like [Cicer arietinum]|uniref:S-protein homolog n=1 Tax=Cicer arietinum TaxID=3827 RepID=A0A1S2Z1W3_CICAR|nr:S-protein homolog 5-like [Cicer arietinum]
MAGPNSITLKLSLLLIVIYACEATENTDFYGTVTVIISNGLAVPPTPTTMTLHCQSKDDDLGFHTLGFAESYQFSFKPEFTVFKNTLFFCSFTWPGNPLRHYLDIYSEKRDLDRCRTCKWKIVNDGGCLYNKVSGLYNICYPWKSVQEIAANSTQI